MITIDDKPIFTEEYDLIEKQAQERRGFSYLKKLKVLIIGSGDTSFRADKNGIWVGAAKFVDAPFSVTMAGVVVATGLSVSGGTITGSAISGGTIAGAAISAGTIAGTTITGGTIRTSSGTTRVEMSSANTLTIYQDGVARVGLSAGAIGFANPAGAGSGSIFGGGTNKLVINTGAYGYYFDEAALYPTDASTLDLGAIGAEWQNVYADGYPASPIQVSKSGIEVFRKITKIAHKGNKYTLETKDLPEEFKIKDKKGKEHTELKRTVGLCVQGIMELIVDVDKLKDKIK